MELMRWVRLQWDRVAAWVAVGLGLIVLLVGWIGVSGTEYPAEQIPYIVSGGLLGVFLLGIGAVLWLSADLRDEWRKLDRIEQLLRDSGGMPAVAPVEPAPAPPVVTVDEEPAKPAPRKRRAAASAS